MDKRVHWIDALKGIAIFYVVLGHIYKEGYFFKIYIFSFHMPLFFFLSGYLFNSRKYDRLITFIKSRLYSIVIPFIFFFFLSYAYLLLSLANENGHNVIYILRNKYIGPALYEKLFGLIYANGYWLNKINNVALWFLPCLFVTQNIFYLINKIFRNNIRALYLPLFIISLCSYAISLFGVKQLPWAIDASLTAIVFYGLGYIIKEKIKDNNNIISPYRKNMFILFLLSICTSIVASQLNGRIDMNGNHYGNYILFYLAACSGIFSYIYLSTTIFYKSKFLSYLGKNSIVIFGIHLILIGPVINSLNFFVELFTDKDIVIDYHLYMFIIALLTIIYIMPIIYVINNYFPFFVGKRKVRLQGGGSP